MAGGDDKGWSWREKLFGLRTTDASVVREHEGELVSRLASPVRCPHALALMEGSRVPGVRCKLRGHSTLLGGSVAAAAPPPPPLRRHCHRQ